MLPTASIAYLVYFRQRNIDIIQWSIIIIPRHLTLIITINVSTIGNWWLCFVLRRYNGLSV